MSAIKDIQFIENLASQIVENTKALPLKDLSSKKEEFSHYYDSMAKATLAAFETAILEWGESEAELDEAIATTSISLARRILLQEDLRPEMSKGIQNELREDRARLIKELEKENERLKKMKNR